MRFCGTLRVASCPVERRLKLFANVTRYFMAIAWQRWARRSIAEKRNAHQQSTRHSPRRLSKRTGNVYGVGLNFPHQSQQGVMHTSRFQRFG